MSSVIVLRQRETAHLLTDSAAYDRATGVLVSNNLTKAVTIPTLHMAVACTGPAALGPYFGSVLSQEFSSFDDVIDRGEAVLPELFDTFATRARGGDAISNFFIIGWHSAANRPAAYGMNMWTYGCSRLEDTLKNSTNVTDVKPFKLAEEILAGTVPDAEQLRKAGFAVPEDENEMVPEVDLLHLIEIQRHEQIDGHFWAGGMAVLTSVDHDGIRQKVIHRWNDAIGKPITPAPIDYAAWIAERKKVSDPYAGLSRVKRDMLRRKMAKGKAA